MKEYAVLKEAKFVKHGEFSAVQLSFERDSADPFVKTFDIYVPCSSPPVQIGASYTFTITPDTEA